MSGYVPQRYKRLVEYSFYQWILAYPWSKHPNDMKRFYTFVKTVCSYNSKNWKNPEYLRERILEEYPELCEEMQDYFVHLYDHLIDFHKTRALPRGIHPELRDEEPKDGYCFEFGVKQGKFYKKEVPIK